MKLVPAICSSSAALRRQILPLLALALVVAVVLIAHGTSSAQTQFAGVRGPSYAAASLRAVESQIRRYGCRTTRRAAATAGCRQLSARARVLSQAVRRGGAVRASVQPQRRSFFGRLFGGPSQSARPRGAAIYDTTREREQQPQVPRTGNRYRTLCVRTCDGYYWPMSFSTTRSHFGADAARCEASCQSPSKLFVYANPGGSPENMYDLQGNAYTSTENAFLYRTEYRASCRCKPAPWSEEAKAQFEERALAAADVTGPDEVDVDEKPAKVVEANPAPVPRAARRATPRRQAAVRRKPVRKKRRGLFGFLR